MSILAALIFLAVAVVFFALCDVVCAKLESKDRLGQVLYDFDDEEEDEK